MAKKRKPPIRHRVAKVVGKIPIIREVVAPILPPEEPPRDEPPQPTYHEPDTAPHKDFPSWMLGAILGVFILGYLFVSKGCPPEPMPPSPAVVSPTPTDTPNPTDTPTPSPSATDTASPTATSTPSHHKTRCADGKVMGKHGCANTCKDGQAVGKEKCEGK